MRDLLRTTLIAVLLLGCSGGPPRQKTIGSIGAVMSRDRDTGAVYVVELPRDSAAELAGLREGDRIKMVDGYHVDAMKRADFLTRIRGEVGSNVILTILRGDEVVEVELARIAKGPNSLPPAKERIE